MQPVKPPLGPLPPGTTMAMKKYFRQIIDHLQALRSWLRDSLRRNSAGDFKPFRRYRLSLDRTSSLTRLASFSGSKLTMILFAVGVFILAGLLWLAAVVYTPLRNLLPARFTTELRDRYTEMDARLDSVSEITGTYGRYLSNLHAILTDSVSASAPAATAPAGVEDIPLDSLLPASEREKSFVSSFEDEERFNLSVLSPIAAEGMPFFPPVSASGSITENSGAIPSVSVATPSATGVSAIYRGTVVSSAYTSGRGFTVIIQHPNDFISVYSNLSESFCTRGAKVARGERIGLASGSDRPLTFELWHKGSPLRPSDYITFAR